ncbi:methyltransferase domain-containing protein [Agromyces sp. ISL-38]|uniref:class I SAM-dependent methyltransferase n=1 Tax=Agromyces sp. ISL-38 TaxID=2819107 RepID=UPI001BE9D414|nr:methyltransferase domain-containing protein [Agromyces sp. ISL-38]MBT2499459.1 methyltransferase domain-containing protein [Agromyces sp. ISL-38]MBT2518009.1 methyltransferase domain-containing protein [Streptomyces sp. ISL-90]
MNGADPDRWSGVAANWAELWGGFADPARRALIEHADVRPGTRVLDVGCGSGEFLTLLADLGAEAVGVDPAPGMVAIARRSLPNADIREGDFSALPWPDGTFDVVTAVNALQFADDMVAALREATRVLQPGGRIGIANWAEAGLNDLDTIEDAVADAAGEKRVPGGDYRRAGGLQSLFARAGLEVTATGLVETLWRARDEDTLVRGVLLGDAPERVAAVRNVVIEAAHPFRTAEGGYLLRNAFRYAVGHDRVM